MRLWKALHTLCLGNKGARRADGPRTRLEVEALDQRLLPSSFQWGVGRGIELLSYDLATHKAGALVSSHQVSRVSEIVVTKDTDSSALVNRHAHTASGTGHVATKSISLNFPTESISFNFTRIELENVLIS